MLKISKEITSWVMSIIVSALLVNAICFLYEHPVAWLDTPNGASRAIRRPYSLLVHGTEGYSISQIDINGYTNPNYPLNDSYVLMMGASHTQGKELSQDKRYSVLVNNALSDGENVLYTYNIAGDGNFLPSILKHFQSAIVNYPNASCITIEIGSTDYPINEIEEAISAIDNIDSTSAEQLFSQLGVKSKLKNVIKEAFPLAPRITSQIETNKAENSIGGGYSVDEENYEITISQALCWIRSLYSGSIVFVYHPETDIQEDGSLLIERSQTIELFKSSCEVAGIDFIDVGNDFQAYYDEYHELPYGFANTTPGNGHMNEIGQRIMADAILGYLKEVGLQ